MTDDGFGPLLRALREERLLNQAALAGVVAAAVSYWEAGAKTPQRAMVAKLVAALDGAGALLPEDEASLYWSAGVVPPMVDVGIMAALVSSAREQGERGAR